MNKNLDDLLCKQYPKIFKYRSLPGRMSAMGSGFSHDDGWFNILDTMCRLVQNHINHSRQERARVLKYNRALARALKGDKNPLINYFMYRGTGSEHKKYALKQVENILAETDPQPRAVPEACQQVVADQVKEKFGTLRFYYSGGDEYVYGIIRMAEAMTAHTCEVCGAPGQAESVSGWVKTVCAAHSRLPESSSAA